MSEKNIAAFPWFGTLWVFLGIVAAILICPWFDPEGFLTTDSAFLLRYAQRFVESNTFEWANYFASDPAKEQYFLSIFPMGYPSLIAIVTKLSGCTVFFASKLVNVICLGFAFRQLWRIFRRNTFFLGMIFGFGAFLEFYYFSLTEAPYFSCLVWFGVAWTRYLAKPTWLAILEIGFSGIALFLFRYVGLFSALTIGLMGIYYLSRSRYRREGVRLLLCATGVGILCGGYLALNYVTSGYLTGADRAAKFFRLFQFPEMLIQSLGVVYPEAPWQIWKEDTSTVKIVVRLILFFFPFLVGAFFVGLATKIRLPLLVKEKRLFSSDSQAFFLLTVGQLIFYLILSQIGVLIIQRYFVPIVFTGMVSVLAYLNRAESKSKGVMQWTVLTIFVVSFFYHFPYQVWSYARDQKPTYLQTVEQTLLQYERVPDRSVVLMGSNHIFYLRPTVQVLFSKKPGYNGPELSLPQFLERVRRGPLQASAVFIASGHFPSYQPDPEIVELFRENRASSLIRIYP